MSAPFHLQGQQLSVTPSIGIVLFPRDGQDVDTLLQRADMAMYAAKQGGRNRLEYYHPELLRNSQIMVVRANPLVRTDISEMLTGS
jgi:predicted signal transduction protein with EAL and GGDEF domain